jgi:hypothetical protein
VQPEEVKRLIRDVECNDHYPLLILKSCYTHGVMGIGYTDRPVVR